MDSIEVTTLIYLPPREVHEFLMDFPGYADYSKYLRRVTQDGDGGTGTRYHLTFAWSKLQYTAHTRVSDVDPPTEIDWEVIEDLDARGKWVVEEVPEEAPPDRETASRVRLVVDYDPGSVSAGALDLPRFVSLGWVLEKAEGLIREEGERVVERIVEDLEGRRRPVELHVDVGR